MATFDDATVTVDSTSVKFDEGAAGGGGGSDAYTFDSTVTKVDDTVVQFDAPVSGGNISRLLADSVQGVEALVRIAKHPRSTSDVAGPVTDAVVGVTGSQGKTRNPTDTAVVSDAIARQVKLFRRPSDTAAASDVVVAGRAPVVRALTESAPASDSVSATVVPATPPLPGGQYVGLNAPKLIVADKSGNRYAELDKATLQPVTWGLGEYGSFSFTIPVNDPKAAQIQTIKREVQIWQDGIGHPVHVGVVTRKEKDGDVWSVQCQGIGWYLKRRHIGGQPTLKNLVKNGDFELMDTGFNPPPASGTKTALRYFLAAHPDDDFSAWAFVQNQAQVYPVFFTLTRGERTSMCDMSGLQTSLGETTPSGSTCAEKRMSAWHAFHDAMVGEDSLLNTVAQMTYYGPSGSPSFEMWVGPKSARVAFDLGDGNLSTDEIINAITTFRAVGKPRLPVSTELDIVVSAYYNTQPPGGYYDHQDHFALHMAVLGHDFGVTGSQYGRTAENNTALQQGGIVLQVPDQVYDHTMRIEASGWRTGHFQRIFGWLDWTNAGWPYGDNDVVAGGLAKRQAFWRRY